MPDAFGLIMCLRKNERRFKWPGEFNSGNFNCPDYGYSIPVSITAAGGLNG